MENNTFKDKLLSKFGPTKLIVLSFVIVILIGGVLLTLPISNVDGNSLSFLNNIFVNRTSKST